MGGVARVYFLVPSRPSLCKTSQPGTANPQPLNPKLSKPQPPSSDRLQALAHSQTATPKPYTSNPKPPAYKPISTKSQHPKPLNPQVLNRKVSAPAHSPMYQAMSDEWRDFTCTLLQGSVVGSVYGICMIMADILRVARTLCLSCPRTQSRPVFPCFRFQVPL